MTKTNTYGRIVKPASLRSDIVRLRPGLPFAFPPESAFAFGGTRTLGLDASDKAVQLAVEKGEVFAHKFVESMLNTCNIETSYDALNWTKEFALAGQSAAAVRVAEILMEGEAGTRKNPSEALEWAQRAIDGGNSDGYQILGALYMQGIAVPQDRERAIDLWLRAAQFGNQLAQFKIASVLAYGLSARRPTDKLQAYKWALLAASSPKGIFFGLKFGNRERKDLYEKSIELRDELESALSPKQRATAQALATAWRPLPSHPSTAMPLDIAEHEEIRERILGPSEFVTEKR